MLKIKKIDEQILDACVEETYTCGNYTILRRVFSNNRNYFSIRANEDASRFLPEIYHNYPPFFRNPDTESERFKKGYFYIQTIAYGGLELDEYGEFIKAVTHAQKVVEALTEYFIKGVK